MMVTQKVNSVNVWTR